MKLLRHLLLLKLLVRLLPLPLLGRAASGSNLLLGNILCVAASHSFRECGRHLTRRQARIGRRSSLVLVTKLILMTGNLLTSGLSRVLILCLGIVAHQASRRSRLPLLLMRCVGDVCQVLPLALVVRGGVGAPLDVLRVVRFGLHNEGSHVILDVLLHE